MRKRLRLIVIIVCVLVLVGLRVFSPEDGWICDGNILIKHGNPSVDGSGFFCSGGVLLSFYAFPMKITAAFAHNEIIPRMYTCDGEGFFPVLTVEEIPDMAKTLALVVEDPDAPAGVWNHLLLVNIPVEGVAQTISQDDFATAIFGQNSWGELAWGTPCPPSGTHRYVFKVYALSKVLEISSGFSKERLYEVMSGNIVAQAELVGVYARQ